MTDPRDALARTAVPARTDALAAVLELHKPVPCTITDGTAVTEGTTCDHCLEPAWPCATVAAIYAAAPHLTAAPLDGTA